MIRLAVREKNEQTGSYRPLQETGLKAEIQKISGSGDIKEPFVWEISVENPSGQTWEGVLRVELPFDKEAPEFFLPGFLYGTNRGDAPLRVDNEYPRLREGEMDRPASPWWMVRGDRLSHPLACVKDGNRIYGLSASPYYLKNGETIEAWTPGKTGEFYQYAGFYCSLEDGAVGYTLGYENAPWLYIQSHTVREREAMGENCFRLPAKGSVRFQVLEYCCEAAHTAQVGRLVEEIYWKYHQAPREAASMKETVQDIAGAVSTDAWLEEDCAYSGFVFEHPDGSLWYRKLPSVTWTNGVTVAVPMLLAAFRTGGDQGCEMRRQALACIEKIVSESEAPGSGLPWAVCDNGNWSNRGWWFDGMHTPGHSGYLVGQLLYYVLEAWEAEKKYAGQEHPEWLTFVGRVLERLEDSCNTDGEFPYILSETTGAGLEYDAMGSCWILAAMAYFDRLTGNRERMEMLRKSEAHYYKAYVSKMVCYGGPLDTDKAVDSEGVLSYLRAVGNMHRLTGEEQYLDHMKQALDYEFSFKFCYNSPIKTPPLGKIGWSSCGGSITSVANPHIHPMSSTVTGEMTYYLKFREDAYVAERLKDTLLWSCQNHNRFDREFDYGRKGWMSERFCHCQGLLVQEYPDGSKASTWFALMPWACGSILEGLCRVLVTV
mgnify:CR=1 FL=1